METPKPSALRRYIYEYALLGLLSGLVVEALVVKSLYVQIIEDKREQITSQQRIIEQNTQAMQEFLNFQRFSAPRGDYLQKNNTP